MASFVTWPGNGGSLLAASQQMLLGGIFLVVVLLLGFFLPALLVAAQKFFGPVLFYDLVRIARQRRYYLLRMMCAGGLAGIFAWICFMWYMNLSFRQDRKITIQDTAQLAEYFFVTFLYVEFIMVFVLTPAYTAGAIADEKDRRTLEFLLATDLRNREIVLSKMASRLANIVLVILVGLPILSFTQFFGGIDPDLLLASFVALGITAVSLASLSILNSVYARKARDAIVMTYLLVAMYLGLSLLAKGLVSSYSWLAQFPSTKNWTSPVTLNDVVDWFNTGNIFSALIELTNSYVRGKTLQDELLALLGAYALFHGLVTLGSAAWAVARVRIVALQQAEAKRVNSWIAILVYVSVLVLAFIPVLGWAALVWLRPWNLLRQPLGGGGTKRSQFEGMWTRPRLGRWPMLWKETFAEPGLRFHMLGRIVIAILFAVSMGPAVSIIGQFLFDLYHQGRGPSATALAQRFYLWNHMAENMNIWVRITATGVACLMLLGVAVRAASSVSGERDRQTLDGLLTSPLSCEDILFAKWLGCILSMRLGWLWLGMIWALGIVAGGLQVWAVPLLVVGWLVYATLFAGIGLWYSINCGTTLRATIWTLLTTAGISVGHWVFMGMCCFMPLGIMSAWSSTRVDKFVEFVAKVEFGQCPPLVLGMFAFRGDEFDEYYGQKDNIHMTLSCLFGVFTWGIAAVVMWFATSQRFQTVTGRGPQRRPELSKPKRAETSSDVPSPGKEPPTGILEAAPPVEETEIQPAASPAGGPPQLRGAVEIEDRPSDSEPSASNP